MSWLAAIWACVAGTALAWCWHASPVVLALGVAGAAATLLAKGMVDCLAREVTP